MKTTVYKSFVALLILLLLAGLSLVIQSCSHQKQPNILLIVIDDLGYADMSCTGLAKDVTTPNIDLLAESGVRFTQAYATSPICNPSRCGIMTGCYPERWGTWWYGGPGLYDPEYTTIAEILENNGYRTAHIGKVHYGSSDSDTSSRSFPLNHGFDYFYGFTSARKHYLIHHTEYENAFQQTKKEYQKKGQSLRQQGLWENTSIVDTLAFSTELFTKKALEIIRTPSDKPFFLHLSYNAVHNFTHQLPREYLDQNGLEGYHDWDPATEEYYEWYQQGRYPNNREGRAHYLGQLSFLDEMIGWLLHELLEQQIDENTVVVLIGDNGGSTPIYANNHPLRGSKYVLYEGGIRVPMIMAWLGKYEKDMTVENVVSAMDIFPTLCRAANIFPPDHLNGKDLSMLLTGADPAIHHDTLVWDTQHEIAVRGRKWKYHLIKDIDHAVYEMVELEKGEFLYDLEDDPGERYNLAKRFPDTLELLKRHHENWEKRLSDLQ